MNIALERSPLKFCDAAIAYECFYPATYNSLNIASLRNAGKLSIDSETDIPLVFPIATATASPNKGLRFTSGLKYPYFGLPFSSAMPR